jgi:hypothetical protein
VCIHTCVPHILKHIHDNYRWNVPNFQENSVFWKWLQKIEWKTVCESLVVSMARINKDVKSTSVSKTILHKTLAIKLCLPLKCKLIVVKRNLRCKESFILNVSHQQWFEGKKLWSSQHLNTTHARRWKDTLNSMKYLK